MNYYSTERKSSDVSFKEAILKGLAPDRGLYMPHGLPHVAMPSLQGKSFQEIAWTLAKELVDGEIPDDTLRDITDDAFNFPVPLKHINDNIYSLELYHGPTAAFKDFGARFMARVMSYFLGDKKLTILVATSGDTGSAVAKGFYGLPNINVVILYPSGKVSPLQEKQLTTLGGNISALEIKGSFDECQRLVKDAFMDKELAFKLNISSANSINIGRLYPQSFYYVKAALDLQGKTPVFATPSGNFGNLTGGLIAKHMGLDVNYFIAATNVNDTVPEYLETNIYRPRPSIQTYSNAMDVGDPSNFARMKELYPNIDEMKKAIVGYRVTHEETAKTMQEVYKNNGYLLDPHGAVAYHAINKHIEKTDDNITPFVLLETAHPAKFMEVIEEVVGITPKIPSQLQEYLNKTKVATLMGTDYKELKEYLLHS